MTDCLFACLDSDLQTMVTSRWDQPCKEAFEYILAQDPTIIANVITSTNLSIGDLISVVEVLGESTDANLVQSTLAPLLQHSSTPNSDGVVYGTSDYLNNLILSIFKKLEIVYQPPDTQNPTGIPDTQNPTDTQSPTGMPDTQADDPTTSSAADPTNV